MEKVEKIKDPAVFVILGVTGDLSTKKILPSLWHLFKEGLLPEHFSVIGLARKNFSDRKFRKLVRQSIKNHSQTKITRKDFSHFIKMFFYRSGTLEKKSTFESLDNFIKETEKNWEVCTNKLFCLAVPPATYKDIFKNLTRLKLNVSCQKNSTWNRILIEKPFGTNLESSQKLQALLSSHFEEEQIYRIDHYLFKEIVQGIENFRFSNNLFEKTWDNSNIERIDIKLYETLGVEERGSFYDSIGALRDVGQNHLLSMLAAITMEYNFKMTDEAMQNNRFRILDSLRPWNIESIKKETTRGQYQNYNKIQGVFSDSKTETYFAIKTELNHPRWKGVPIFMEAGKRMRTSKKEIVLTLKHPNQCLLCQTGKKHTSNRIVFRLSPNDEIIIHFWTKKPGFEKSIEERTFSFFLYKKENENQFVEEYAKVIQDAINGERGLFLSSQEVEAAWKFVDPLIRAWEKNLTPLISYLPGENPKSEIPNIYSQKIYGEIE